LAGALLAASFSFGFKWEVREHSSELAALQARLESVDTQAKTLNDDLLFLRKKAQVLELTATLQFQAMLLGKEKQLYQNPFLLKEFAFNDDEFMRVVDRYSRLVHELQVGQPNAQQPFADLKIPRAGPSILVFRDGTKWIPFALGHD
jgi:hypothetical protein